MTSGSRENTLKKLIIATMISSILLYFSTAYFMYCTYTYNNPNFRLSADFFIKHVGTIFSNIGLMLQFTPPILPAIPFLLIFPVIYLLTFYKVYMSSKPMIIKYKLPLFTFFLVSLFWVIFVIGDAWATF